MSDREKRLEDTLGKIARNESSAPDVLARAALADDDDRVVYNHETLFHFPESDQRGEPVNEEGNPLNVDDEAIADDDAGGGDPPCPKHTKGNGPCYCQPNQHRGVTEELNELLEYFRERTLTVAQNLSKSDLVRDEALDMVGRIDRVRRHLTAPPTVPEAVRLLPEQWENEANDPLAKSAQEYFWGKRDAGIELKVAFAQHSEPEDEDE